jgi:hypothetical protein
MIRRLTGWLRGFKADFRSFTGAVFWVTLGSLGTLYFVAPETPLTRQVMIGEICLLVGLALGYLSFGREEGEYY